MTAGDQDGAAKAGLSFGFSKKLTTKVQQTTSSSAAWKKDKDDDKNATGADLVKEVNAKGLQTTKAPEIKKAPVIPCPGNKYKLKESVREATEEEKAAARELIEDSKRWADQNEEEDEKRVEGSIPLTQDEREKKALDADLMDNAAEQSTQDDYEDTPVAGFGMAMLRGMGFDPKVGVGGFNKAVVQCLTPDVRPKGLGLGAQRPNTGGGSGNSKTVAEGGEDLTLKKGAHVIVAGGKNEGCYGKVEGLDEESARVIVKLAVGGGEAVSLSEGLVRVVPREEYKKYSRVINKDAYDKYAKKQQEREIQWDKRDAPVSNSHEKTRNGDSGEYRKEKSKRKRSRSPVAATKKKSKETWLRPSLRVRLIDETSRHYNTKVTVEDVVSPYSCVVRTDSGRVLDDVDPRDCETIVPKGDGHDVVMVVRGRDAGRLGVILGRDKRTSVAAVQLLPDKDQVVKLDYDDICHFVGDVDMYS